MTVETGISEPVTIGTQTDSSKLLQFNRRLNSDNQSTFDEDQNRMMPIGEPKETNSSKVTRNQSRTTIRKSSTATTHEKDEKNKYYRDTLGLGHKGARNTNIGIQCDIKIAAGHYRQLQRQCIDMRLEKEKMIVRERELEDRINRLIEEKEKVN